MGGALKTRLLCSLIGSLLILLDQVSCEVWGDFHESPIHVITKPGEDVILTCRIKMDKDHPPVKWAYQKTNEPPRHIGTKQYPNLGTIDPKFPRCFWTNKNNSGPVFDNKYRIFDLIIKNITKSDAGNYTCIRKHDDYRTVQVVMTENQRVFGFEDWTSDLVCYIPDVESAYWEITKNDGVHKLPTKKRTDGYIPLEYSDRVIYTGHTNGRYDLYIIRLKKFDRGVYRCMSGGKTFVTIHFEVGTYSDPVFTRSPHDTYALIGKEVTLRCAVAYRNDYFITDKWPKIIARWKKSKDSQRENPISFNFKHNDTVYNRRYYWTSTGTGNFDITLRSVKRSDEGFYWCEAQPDPFEPFDSVFTAGATLKVFRKPERTTNGYVPTLSRTSFWRSTGGSVKFRCVPNHKAIWLDDDFNVLTDGTERVTVDQSIGINTYDKFPDGLEIKNVQLEHSRKYYCVLVGDEFVWEITVLLYVEGCPSGYGGRWHHHNAAKMCFGSHPTARFQFGDATRWCRQNNAEMIMPKTPKEARILQEAMNAHWEGGTRATYLGIDDIEKEGRWKWADGRPMTSEEQRWKWSYPNNKGNADCGLFDRQKQLMDETCVTPNTHLCQYPSIHWNSQRVKEKQRCPDGWTSFDCGGFCYWKSSFKLTWDEARQACERKSASLVKIKSRRQLRAVQLMLDNGLNKYKPDLPNLVAWIGLRRVDDIIGDWFEWHDGTREDPSTLPFANPNYRDSDNKCNALGLFGYIQTQKCSWKRYFVCQLAQRSVSISDRAFPFCGKTWYYEAPMHRDQTKRQVSKVTNPRNNVTNDRISLGALHGGNFVPIVEAPWAVRIFSQRFKTLNFVCNGVLIGPKTVLTSARCMLHKEDMNMTSHTVFVGLATENKNVLDGRIEPIQYSFVHPAYHYSDYGIHHDIAIIELKREQLVDCWNVRPACLPENKLVNFVGLNCVVISWGASDRLQVCKIDTDKILLRDHLIVYSRTETCRLSKLDYGAPLLCRTERHKGRDKEWTLHGIYSGTFGKYVQFLEVRKYLNWIEGKMLVNWHHQRKWYYETTCFHEELDISCDHGRPPYLHVHQAYYGANYDNKCRWQQPKKMGCAHNVHHILNDICRGKNRCRLNVTAEIFGDPCPGFMDFLDIVYVCLPNNRTTANSGQSDVWSFHQTLCNEYDLLDISCGVENPDVIEIQFAIYARATEGKCPNERQGNPDCETMDVSAQFRDRCDGKNTCSYHVSFDGWGDPCPGYTKSLKVTYHCVKKNFQQTICHVGGNMEISCKDVIMDVIKVRSATWSRAKIGHCPNERPGTPAHCTSKDVTEELEARCDGRRVCRHQVSKMLEAWGDPCVGYPKALVLTYNCVEKNRTDIIGHPMYLKAAGPKLQPSTILLAMTTLMYWLCTFENINFPQLSE